METYFCRVAFRWNGLFSKLKGKLQNFAVYLHNPQVYDKQKNSESRVTTADK